MALASTTGYRRLTPASVAARSVKTQDSSLARRELAQDAKAAGEALELRPTLRLILNALVGVYGGKPVNEKVYVWPSNEYLQVNTGLSERAVRYALRDLMELGLIVPNDSSNGKRFAIFSKQGELKDAFGFDLAPLHARRAEFDDILALRKNQQEIIKRSAQRITTCRRTVFQVIQELTDAFPDVLSVEIRETYSALVSELPRRWILEPDAEFVNAWLKLHDLALQVLETAGNGGNSCRLIETNNDSDSDCSKGSGRELCGATENIDLALVQAACPALAGYGGRADTWEGLIASARFLRPTIGAHESAWNEAVAAIGAPAAAVILVMVLQLYEQDAMAETQTIRNPGGYFRAMCRLMMQRRLNLRGELERLEKQTGARSARS
jgi:replication initiation protein RepC